MSMTKKTNYDELYDLTEKLYGNKLPLPVKHKNYLTRWNDLIDYWEKLGADDPTYPVVHKIYWGRYPDNVPLNTHGKLYTLFEEEILNRGSSMHRARKPYEHFFSYTFTFWKKGCADVSDDLSYHSTITKEYVYYKASAKLCGHAPNVDSCSFERVIRILIPAARGWSDAEWSDDRNIFKAIKEKYGVDYTLYPESFKQLYQLLDKRWNQGRRGSYNDIFCVEHLSWELATEIWPENTKKFILKKFCDAKKHVQKCKNSPYHRKVIISKETLDRSWVIPYVSTLPEDVEEKKMLFEVMLNI